MAGKGFRVRIAKGDREFEVEGDKVFVLQMLKRLEELSPSVSMIPEAIDTGDGAKGGILKPAQKSGKTISVGEYVRQLGLKKHTDLVLGFGYYLEHYAGLKQFTPADINNCYYEAKLENSNTSQMIIHNIRRGYMMQSKSKGGGKKSYILTQSGEEYLKQATKAKK